MHNIFSVFLFSIILNPYLAHSPAARNDYLGQPKPGHDPEVFAPGFVSTKYAEFAGTFSPDMQEYYFTRRGPFLGGIAQVMVSYRTADGWSNPERAPFSTDHYEFEPHITPHGNRLYFGSRRSPNGIIPPGEMHQWYLEKHNGGWTDPMLLGDPFFGPFIMYPCVSWDSTLYFTGVDGIYFSECLEGEYQEPLKMGPEINFQPMTAHSYIAPDESYLIFDAQPRGEGLSDLFISYRNANGTWCKGKPLGNKINAGSSQAIASVSPDGECLFFTRNQDIYWMDASIIDRQRLIPQLSCSGDSGYAPLEIQFELDLSTVPDSLIEFAWDFDHDGITDSNIPNPTCTYTEKGIYSVKLEVFSTEDSATWIWWDLITVSDTSDFGLLDLNP